MQTTRDSPQHHRHRAHGHLGSVSVPWTLDFPPWRCRPSTSWPPVWTTLWRTPRPGLGGPRRGSTGRPGT